MEKRYKVKESVLNCKKIDTAIERAKRELVNQEPHENFGQEYVRAIKDKFSVGLSYTLEDKMNMAKIDSFDNWCSTYTPQRGKNNQIVR